MASAQQALLMVETVVGGGGSPDTENTGFEVWNDGLPFINPSTDDGLDVWNDGLVFNGD